MALGLLAVLGMPLGLLVVGVLVVRAGVRSGLRIGFAVALVALVTAVLAYATALAELEVAGRLNGAEDCEGLARCIFEMREAFDVTPVRDLGRYLFGAAAVEAVLLALWEWRRPRSDADVFVVQPLTVVAGLAALLAAYVGRAAWTLPVLVAATPDDLEVGTHVQRGFLGMLACLVAIAGIVLAVRVSPIRRPGPWGRVRAVGA